MSAMRSKPVDINEVRRMKRRKEIEAQYVKFYGYRKEATK